MQTTTIYLPRFPGFYESILSSYIDSCEEMMINDFIEDGKIPEDCTDKYEALTDIIDIDYKKTHDNIARQYFDEYEKEFGSTLEADTGIKLIAYNSLRSPAYYNFANDEIDMDIEYDLDKIISYLTNHKESFTAYIKENNTSYDGFIAYLDNTFNEYIQELRDDMREAQLTQIIDFWHEQNNHSMDDIQNNVCEAVYECMDYKYIPTDDEIAKDISIKDEILLSIKQ